MDCKLKQDSCHQVRFDCKNISNISKIYSERWSKLSILRYLEALRDQVSLKYNNFDFQY